MANKFCRIIENKEGKQLLLQIEVSDKKEDAANFVLKFQIDEGVYVSLTIQTLPWDEAQKLLETYETSKGLDILKDPISFIQNITA